jgi:hypothetical protein
MDNDSGLGRFLGGLWIILKILIVFYIVYVVLRWLWQRRWGRCLIFGWIAGVCWLVLSGEIFNDYNMYTDGWNKHDTMALKFWIITIIVWISTYVLYLYYDIQKAQNEEKALAEAAARLDQQERKELQHVGQVASSRKSWEGLTIAERNVIRSAIRKRDVLMQRAIKKFCDRYPEKGEGMAQQYIDEIKATLPKELRQIPHTWDRSHGMGEMVEEDQVQEMYEGWEADEEKEANLEREIGEYWKEQRHPNGC